MLSLLHLELISGNPHTPLSLNSPCTEQHGCKWLINPLSHPAFRWACDNTVTHYIYQGRVGDNTREYRGVKERGLHVVSQYWLEAVSSPLANMKTQC